jgi:hypothetical protein
VVPALVAAALAAAVGAAAAPTPTPSHDAPGQAADALEPRRAEVARELLRVGEELRRELLAGDDRAIAARIPADGLRCAGRLLPRARVQRDLATPGSWLHDTLLGGGGVRAAGAPPVSVAEMLRASPEVAMAVSFVNDPRALPLGRPCLEFRGKDVQGPVAPFCFERRDGRWWLTESLYPCG